VRTSSLPPKCLTLPADLVSGDLFTFGTSEGVPGADSVDPTWDPNSNVFLRFIQTSNAWY